ncbi:hypothetical protein EZ449_14585 [Pedobacter frigidisoli]|uniref:ABC-2 type transport system permease protein n=1 Tax=Pedobacter frigidisoli TaxID=2530455 RepID=A0A4R0P220_9SPHI|nr:hypothetical protein [Pedobacter frigidisoli]TCD07016.1 hypothetical protein EZ449_14585 [Pedobacter frigidisoli]
MNSALNSILRKIFVFGFYRSHAGMLAFIFIMLISYCFFINTLGTVRSEEIDFWQFFFTIGLVSNPLIMICYLLICLIYTYKSWQYFIFQFTQPNHQFLYYSVNTYSKNIQLKSWFLVQLQVFTPILIYTIYAAVIGLIFHYYLISACILLFVFLLAYVSAVLYVYQINKLYSVDEKPLTVLLFKRISKPIFLLYTLMIFNQAKLGYLLTKALSWVLIWSVFFLFIDLQNDLRLLLLISSFIAISHAFLIYRERDFNDTSLNFLKNFPYSYFKLFFGFCLNYIVILLPEIFWLITKFGIEKSGILILFILAAMLLFRSILYLGMRIKGFLITIFFLLSIFYIIILFGYGWSLIPMNFGLAFIIFRKNYFH